MFKRNKYNVDSVIKKISKLSTIDILPDNEKNMLNGVISILLMVDDVENRRIIAQKQIQQYIAEGIQFDADEFLRKAGL
jgi:hypothetical protein